MKTFKDSADRVWSVVINVNAVRRCRSLVDVDLPDLASDGCRPLGALLGDVVKLVDVLYVLCKAEADSRGLTDEDFGAGLGGDSLQNAADAFVAELADFFPDPRVRAGLKAVIEKGRAVQSRLMEVMAARLAAIDPDALAATLTTRSTDAPESSD
jgi:hypothetical protein